MQWIAPFEKDAGTAALEKRLWDAADQFRANSGLKSQGYSAAVLGRIFAFYQPATLAAWLTEPDTLRALIQMAIGAGKTYTACSFTYMHNRRFTARRASPPTSITPQRRNFSKSNFLYRP